jgi:uncharacterized membrane protein
LSAAILDAFDIVLLEQPMRAFGPEEAAALEAWVAAGGSLMSLAGYVNAEVDWEWPDSLLAKMPIQYAPGLIVAGPFGWVTNFTGHPVTAGLRRVPFWGGYHVAVKGACAGHTQVVAFAEGGPVGVVCQHGAGRIYLWGDEWVEYSSQWDSSTDAPQFWRNAIDWLARRS